MAATRGTAHLGSWNRHAPVAADLEGVLANGLVEAGPARARVEFRVRAEQVGAAAGAAVDPLVLHVHVCAGERGLGRRLPQNLVLVRRQLLLPILVGEGDLFHALIISRGPSAETSRPAVSPRTHR